MPSNRLTPDELTALEELVAKMTPGEWFTPADWAPVTPILVTTERPVEIIARGADRSNMLGLGALRNAAPALLAMARLCYQLENDRAKAADLIPKILENLDEPELADILRKAIHAP